ncbi:DUF3467 domain-containing protein [Methanosarcina mazei]|jgi:hypothetical protein|uniref:DUF3467 domain-containing protein n=1 Tax=Methanosarcina mazei LYC TaxID=1434114 RepID=A0A0E3RQX1_METMZ|nr:DUF3467 domain-containing protein [Methanosarcina mazei]AKB67394.1 hypothetical protein MSMAL_0851 [Methanosarcina mazei LYC]
MSETEETGEKQVRGEDKIAISRAHNFSKYYVTNIDGGLTNQDFRYQLMNEKLYDQEDKEWLYIADALVILSPIAAKKMFNKLAKDLDTYEAKHGTIQTDFEKDLTY